MNGINAESMKNLADEMDSRFDLDGNLISPSIDLVYEQIKNEASCGNWQFVCNFKDISTTLLRDIMQQLKDDDFEVELTIYNREADIEDLDDLIIDWERDVIQDSELVIYWGE